MTMFSRLLPLGCAVLAMLGVTLAMVDHQGGDMHLYEFGKTPVQDGGRIKPIDTVARVSLLAISGEQTWKDVDGKTQPAIKWLLDAESGGPRGPGLKHKVFRIANEDLLALLGLQRRPGLRYALSEFAPKIGELEREANRVVNVADNDRSAYERAVDELARHVKLYLGLATQQTPRLFPPAQGNPERDRWQTFADVEDTADGLVDELARRYLAEHGKGPQDVDKLTKEQQAELAALRERGLELLRDRTSPAVQAWQDILTAYRAGDDSAFNKALDDYRAKQTSTPERDVRKAGFEAFFNDFNPFFISVILYVAAFVLVCLSWLLGSLLGLEWHRPLIWSASAVMLVALVVHGFGLGGRMYLSDRWLVFVTNLYSSAVFIAFGAALAGLALEAVFGYGIGAAVGSFLGFTVILVGGTLVKGEDTLEMMRAVLDTNFWLATHVTCVTLGYMATFVAGALGTGYIGTGLFSPALRDRTLLKTLSQAIYGVLCFAMLFSFTGTVLGGVWADQSWGRFWGWDPKENGALLIVLWNALILHARWCGMVKPRGVAVLTVVGNMITAWSWFGTNQLGIGLHAYGFDSGLSVGLTTFWASQLAVIALGLIPLKYWQSFAPRPTAA